MQAVGKKDPAKGRELDKEVEDVNVREMSVGKRNIWDIL